MSSVTPITAAGAQSIIDALTNPTFGLPYDHIQPPDEQTLNQMLDKTKGRLFFKRGAGFLGSLLCDHEFVWDTTCATAWCNGFQIGWNPKFFAWLTIEERVTVLAHELWHTGYGHVLTDRFIGFCPDYANKAMDFVINNDLDHSGYVFGEKLMSLKPCLDHQYDNMTTEEVYQRLNPPPSGQPMPQPGQDPGNKAGDQGGAGGAKPDPNEPLQGDVRPTPNGPGDQDKIMGKLVKAAQASKMAKEAGVVPGEVEQIIEFFLKPILPWEVLLQRFFTDLSNDDYSWKRPSRRYDDEYLPSLMGENGLEHLIYYLDVSGSVSDNDVLRFNSEVKHIHDDLRPKKLTLVTFDTKIQDIYEFEQDMPFEKIVIHGRGGTSLKEVEEHIRRNQPTAAVVFSDLYCKPMKHNPGVPVLWVIVDNKKAVTPFGQNIHIKSE